MKAKTPREYLETVENFDMAKVPVGLVYGAAKAMEQDVERFLQQAIGYAPDKPMVVINNPIFQKALMDVITELDPLVAELIEKVEQSYIDGKPCEEEGAIDLIAEFNQLAHPNMVEFLARLKMADAPDDEYAVALKVAKDCYDLKRTAHSIAMMARQIKTMGGMSLDFTKTPETLDSWNVLSTKLAGLTQRVSLAVQLEAEKAKAQAGTTGARPKKIIYN